MPARWEYRVIEEPNALALQDRLAKVDADGWEALSLAYASDYRLRALVRRPAASEESIDAASLAAVSRPTSDAVMLKERILSCLKWLATGDQVIAAMPQ
jgi:hypothetical protein